MKVHLLEQKIDSFISAELEARDVDWQFPHSLVSRFHASWQQLSEAGLRHTYEEALKSEISSQWWKRDHYRPKEMMLILIDADPELAMIAFKELTLVNASLEGRVSRFLYYCESLLDIHRSRKIDSIDAHHHQDAAIISLYLAGMFPELYALYPGLEVFQNFCKIIGSQDIPKVDDLERYMKVVKIVNMYFQKNTHLQSFVSKRNAPGTRVSFMPYQVAYEFIHAVGTKQIKQ